LTYNTISDEILKQLDHLPLELQKKVLEFVRVLNTTSVKGKPGRQLMQFAGILNPSEAKVMEEAIEYDCRRIW
jgi:hypothetical protein